MLRDRQEENMETSDDEDPVEITLAKRPRMDLNHGMSASGLAREGGGTRVLRRFLRPKPRGGFAARM